MLSACGRQTDGGDTGFDIKGMWSLVSVEHLDGTQIKFPNESGTYIVLFDNDSTSYTCHCAMKKNGIIILPDEKKSYSLVRGASRSMTFITGGFTYSLNVLGEERKMRPQLVANALKSVEDEFLGSEEYMSLHNRLSSGKPMGDREWDKVAHQLNFVYPGFTHNLLNLYTFTSS